MNTGMDGAAASAGVAAGMGARLVRPGRGANAGPAADGACHRPDRHAHCGAEGHPGADADSVRSQERQPARGADGRHHSAGRRSSNSPCASRSNGSSAARRSMTARSWSSPRTTAPCASRWDTAWKARSTTPPANASSARSSCRASSSRTSTAASGRGRRRSSASSTASPCRSRASAGHGHRRCPAVRAGAVHSRPRGGRRAARRLGRFPGSLVTGGVVAVIAWFFVGAVSIALVAGCDRALVHACSAAAWADARWAVGWLLRRRRPRRVGGGGFSGGGGGFGGGGASGRW